MSDIERQTMAEERAPRNKRPKSRTESGRKERIPLGARQQKLMVPQESVDDGFVYRWINDVVGRLMKAQQGGWNFVEDPTIAGNDKDTRVSRQVGKTERGEPLYAYLMRIDKEWYEEDQETKQTSIANTESSIKNGQFNREADDGRYTPREGIKLG